MREAEIWEKAKSLDCEYPLDCHLICWSIKDLAIGLG